MAARYRSVLLFGSPGSGKGTQGKILAQVPGLVHLSSGDLFRSLNPKTRLGRIFLEYSSRGELVPDDLTLELWETTLERMERAGAFDPANDLLILDGIPRNVAQAQLMDDKIEVLRIIHLICRDRQVLFERLRRRAFLENRYDDASDAVIQKRLEVYNRETVQVLSHYPPEIVAEVEADRSTLHALARIARIIDEARAASHMVA